MVLCDDEVILLPQLISGILLFERKIKNSELLDVMALVYKTLKCDVVETDGYYDDIYTYLDNYVDGIGISELFDYDSILKVNGKKIKLRDYLFLNTTSTIINFLEDEVFFRKLDYKENAFEKFNSLFLVKKRKHEV